MEKKKKGKGKKISQPIKNPSIKQMDETIGKCQGVFSE
jgi:hypothetical protein